MSQNVDICPKCQNYVEGKKEVSTGRIAVRKASHGVLKWVCMFLLGFVGFFFGGIGAIPGAILGYIIGALITPTANEIGDELYDSLNEGFDLSFTCPKCGHFWSKHINGEGKIDVMPPSTIIEDKKKKYLATQTIGTKNYIKAIIFSILTGITFYYCWVNDFEYQRWQEETWFTKAQYVTDYHWGWLLCAIAFIIFLIYAINSISSIWKKYKHIKKEEDMSLEDFYYSHKYLFGRV